MPKVSYSQKDRAKIKEELIKVTLSLLAEKGMKHTTVENVYGTVGISRTFFYTFFASKEDLIIATLYYQQPKIIAYATLLAQTYASDLPEALRQFLRSCVQGEKKGIAVLSIADQQQLFKKISQSSYELFRQRQFKLFSDLLTIFGVEPNLEIVGIFTNLSLALMVVRKAVPDDLPLLVADTIDKTVEIQIEGIIAYLYQ